NERNAVVNGTVAAVDAKDAIVELAENVEVFLRVSVVSGERVEDASIVLYVGDTVEAKITSVNRKSRNIQLSVRAKDQDDERKAIDGLSNKQDDSQAPKTIGDLIKAQMEGND